MPGRLNDADVLKALLQAHTIKYYQTVTKRVQPKLYQQNIPVDHEPLAGQRENIFHYSAPYFNYSAPHFSQITRVPSPKQVRSHIAFHLYIITGKPLIYKANN